MSTTDTPQNDDNLRQSQIEEYKELGQEYRYREQMMVQQFGFSMLGISVIANLLWDKIPSWKGLIVQGVVVLFLSVIAFHLDHINQDRCAVLDRREQLRDALKFERFHLGVGGLRRSAPRMMIYFTQLLLVGWLIWMVVWYVILYQALVG